MRKVLEYSKYIVFTCFVIGIGFTAYGGVQYYTTSERISEIEDSREEREALLQSSQGEIISPSAVAGTDIAERRELNEKRRDRDTAIRFIGIGIALFATAWILRDVVVARYDRLTGVASENNAENSAESGDMSSV